MSLLATKLARSEFIGNGPVQYRIDGPVETPASISMRVDYADAPVPRDYYVADYFYVENADPNVLMVFGKMEGQDKLRTKLEIFFPSVYFVKQLWKSSRVFHQTLRDYVAQFNYQPGVSGQRGLVAEKAQTLHSNNVFMVISGGDSMMDFYYISPREMYYRPRRKQAIDLEPLARVIISPPLFLGLLNECDAVSQALSGKFGGDDHDDNLESD